MLRFIFTMLFYGAFLGCLAVLCMWFFLGMTVQQSINWLLHKVGQVEIVSDAGDSIHAIKRAGTSMDKRIESVARKFD
mgnify:FL=1